jgi:hypothetical protein
VRWVTDHSRRSFRVTIQSILKHARHKRAQPCLLTLPLCVRPLFVVKRVMNDNKQPVACSSKPLTLLSMLHNFRRYFGLCGYATTLWFCSRFWEVVSTDQGQKAAIEHTPAPPPGARFCVDTSPTEFVCSDDPVKTRKNNDWPYHFENMNLGVPQRIDGTETERSGIRDILELMDNYYYGEVLSNPEYRDVRMYWYVMSRFFSL